MLVLPALLAGPSGEPLDVDLVDASVLRNVVVDLVVPVSHGGVEVTPPMLAVDGGLVSAVTTVDPAGITVTIVIDDGPTVGADVVLAGQSAAVELVRGAAEGSMVAVATPTGRRVDATTERTGTIEEIAAVGTDSGPAIPLPDVVLEEARRLSAAPEPDRHLVVIQNSSGASSTDLDALRAAVIDAGIRLHVVAGPDVDLGALDEVSEDSGGLSPELDGPVAEVDSISHAIRDRVRVTLALEEPGDHEIALTVDDQTFVGRFTVGEPAAVPPPVPTTTSPPVPTTSTSETRSTVPATVPATVPPVTTIVQGSPIGADAARESRSGDGTPLLVLGLLGLGVGACAAGVLGLRSHRRRGAPAGVAAGDGDPVTSEIPVVAFPWLADDREVITAPLPRPRLRPEPVTAPRAMAVRRLDVNCAPAADLVTLPGVGPALAEAIVDERERQGGFGCVDDLRRVRGIGEAKLDSIRPLVTVGAGRQVIPSR